MFRAVFLALLCALAALCGALAPLPAKAEAQKPRHVLLLNSYNQSMTWVRNLTQAVRDTLKPEESGIILHIENMDTKRFLSEPYFDKLDALFAEKYKDVSFDLILSSDNNAFDFLRKHQPSLFPGAPVVFCGVNDFQPEQISSHPNFTGVPEIFSDVDTIETMLRIHPGTRRIVIVNDFTPTGRAWTRTMKQNLAKTDLEKRVEITFAENLPMPELQSRLRMLDQDSLVLIGVFFKDSEGTYFTYEKIGWLIADASNRPVYALLNFNIQGNVVGGNVIGGYFQGRAAAEIGLRVLAGEKPTDIPPMTEGANQNVFDWRQMEIWGIDPDALPKGVKIINRPPSFYDQYKTLVWGVASIVTVLIALLAAAFWVAMVRRKANMTLEATVERRTAQLTASEARFRQLFEDTSDAQLLIEDNRFIESNPAAVKMLRLDSKEQFISAHPSDLSPPLQPDGRPSREAAEEFIAIAQRQGSHRFEWVHRRADGEEFPVEVVLTALPPREGKNLVHVVWRDITERKQAEQAVLESETRLRTAGKVAFDLIYEWDVESGALNWFGDVDGLLGRRPGEISRNVDAWLALIHPDDAGVLERAVEHHATSTSPIQYEYRIQHRDGQYRHWSDRGLPLLDQGGRPTKWIGVCTDISERKNLELALASSEARFRALANASPSGIFETDHAGACTFVNDRLCKITGREASGFLGDGWAGAVAPNDRDRIFASWTAAVESRESWAEEVTFLKTDGGTLPTLCRAEPQYDENRKIIGYVGTVTDVSELKEATDGLERSVEALSRSNSDLQQFAYVASHDLQEPLNLIEGYLNLLAGEYKGKMGDEADEFIDHTQEAAARMKGLIKDLLAYSRVDSKGKPFETTDLTEVMKEALANLRPRIDETEAEIICGDMPTVNVDRAQIARVLQNLIGNSLKYQKPDAKPIVEIAAERAGREWVISVKDNGIGIPEQGREKIFVIFQRMHARHEYPGSGIGLSICKRIVERHGGHIWLESAPGEGSVFSFALPAGN